MNARRWYILVLVIACGVFSERPARAAAEKELRLTQTQYEDRVHAAWAGQVIGMLLAYPFEHRVGAAAWVDDFREPSTWKPLPIDSARVDDDSQWPMPVRVSTR
jgi:hypothetical protein